jgi:hypothetical protein
MATKIRSPTKIVRAVELSTARVNVSTSPTCPVTVATSELDADGLVFAGQIVTLNGNSENFVPCPVVTVSVTPEIAGDGATATLLSAKFGCLLNDGTISP